MADGVVIVCVDDSDRSRRAARTGLATVRPDLAPVVVTVVEPGDPLLVSGTGFAGGSMSPEAFEQREQERIEAARQLLVATTDALGVPDARLLVLRGSPGPAVCELAAAEGAAAVVLGSRGQGGFRRAVLGSVSDHVVRNAPCPVVVTTGGDEPG